MLAELKAIYPRYVALVEKPENINPAYISKMHRLSRQMEEDIFEDFLWGIITGYDAESALGLVEETESPLIIKTALNMAPQMQYTDCFEKCVVIDQETNNKWIFPTVGETTPPDLRNEWTRLNTIAKEYAIKHQQIPDSITKTLENINAQVKMKPAKIMTRVG